MVDSNDFILQENPNMDDYVVGTYLLCKELKSSKEILETAAMMASEQTTGTWVQVPGETAKNIEQFRGKVLNIWEVPDTERIVGCPDEPRTFVMQIGFPWENFGPQIPMLLTTVFGNISMIGDIKLLDIYFPEKFTKAFPGPQFGIAGIRELLGVPDRPLLNNMIKPSTGITPAEGAELLYQVALCGADIIKDDEILADTDFSPALKRVELYMDKLRKAESQTGEKKLYAVNVTDEPDRCIEKAEQAVANGANTIMVNYLPAGISLISSLARNTKINVPILAHLDFGGAFYASSSHGISSALLYGKLARLAGVDLLCIPTPYGKFSHSYLKYIRTAGALRSVFYDKKRTWPIAGGAIKQGHTPKLFDDLGTDFVIGAGGAIHAHPMGPAAGAKAFRQAINLMMGCGKLDQDQMDAELKAAIKLWPNA